MTGLPTEPRNLVCTAGAGVLGTGALSQTGTGEGTAGDTSPWSLQTDDTVQLESTTIAGAVRHGGYADGLPASVADTESGVQTVQDRGQCGVATDSSGAIQRRWGR